MKSWVSEHRRRDEVEDKCKKETRRPREKGKRGETIKSKVWFSDGRRHGG